MQFGLKAFGKKPEKFGGKVKTVLLITCEEANRLVYERGLKNHFAVEFSATVSGGSGEVDAVVYDLSTHPTPLDFEWLEALFFRSPSGDSDP